MKIYLTVLVLNVGAVNIITGSWTIPVLKVEVFLKANSL